MPTIALICPLLPRLQEDHMPASFLVRLHRRRTSIPPSCRAYVVFWHELPCTGRHAACSFLARLRTLTCILLVFASAALFPLRAADALRLTLEKGRNYYQQGEKDIISLNPGAFWFSSTLRR